MKRSAFLLSSTLAALIATAACGVERTTTVLGPTGTGTTSTTKTSTPSLLGTWVVQGTSTTASVKPAASLPSALPDFSSCGNFRWEVTNQTATQVAGSFTADCADGVSVHGNITGQLGGATIPIVLSGELTRAGEGCPFSLTGTGTPIDAQTFHLTYSGTTCLGQMQGSNNLSLAPHSAPTAFTIAGTITDGTSGGVLPGIEASVSGQAVRSDSAGHYQLTGVPAGAVTVQFAAASYVTQTKTLTLSENSTVDAVLQRFAPPAPAPAPVLSSGDQIDMHSVIVRGPGGDVANWPVTTQIRVLDFNFGGVFVDFSAKNSWPEVTPPGWDGGIAYTLWMVGEGQRPVDYRRRRRVLARPRTAGRSAVAVRVELVLQPAGLGRTGQPSAGGRRAGRILRHCRRPARQGRADRDRALQRRARAVPQRRRGILPVLGSKFAVPRSEFC